MTRSAVLRLVLVALSTFGMVGAVCGQTNSSRPNVLFLVADDLNCDLACYGHAQAETPHIDALAERGVLFERAYCQFPLCSPSRASFLTGRRPDATGVLRNPGAARFSHLYSGSPHFREFIPDTVTLPQRFRAAGYTVARIGKLYHYGVPGQVGTSGLDDADSWDYVVNPAGRDKAEEHEVFTLQEGRYGGTLSWMASDGTDLEQTDGLAATSAISLLQSYGDRPFFLAVGFYRPHTPYVAPRPYFERLNRDAVVLPRLSPEDLARSPAAAFASAKRVQEEMDDDLRREAIHAYWASISFMDAQVGRVLDALDELGLADDTVVVMTSDHGYHMYEHGLWQKMSLFENSARVPLIIATPDATQAGARTQALAELVDLYPTLAELCGLDHPDYLDGVSLAPVLADPSVGVRDAAFTQVRRGDWQGYSVRTDRWRYTSWDSSARGRQLYDMHRDAGETTNLADDPAHAAVASELAERVQAYLDRGGRAASH